jgi:demethylmenaquinone methyltransferase/2-methoxy-6-polyprenyl-1,4-benzoquinol methylase
MDTQNSNEMKKTIRSVKESYDKVASLYDLMNRLYFFGKDKEFRSRIVESLNLKPSSIVLNLCCGTGLDFPYLLHKTGDQGIIVGVDLSSQMLRQATQKKGVQKLNLIKADIDHLPFKDKTFNAIMSFCLKITPTYDASIKELARVLQLTGRIGILANHKPQGLLGNIITKILSVMAKIDFEINLQELFDREFTIIENEKTHRDLVQLLILENVKKS